MPYDVRITDAPLARARLLPLWADNLPVGDEGEAKLRWFYCDGPHGEGQAFLLHAGRDEVIGSAGLGVRTLRFHDRPLRAALFADLAVARTQRGGFPALALVREVRHHVEQGFDLGYGFPDARALAVYTRAGYERLGEMRRYVRVLRSRPYVEQRLGPWRALRVAATAVDLSRAAVGHVRAWSDREHRLVWLSAFDERFDLVARRSRLAAICCERGADFLTWRFGEQPGRVYQIAALLRRGELRAYAVVHDAGATAELADLFGLELPDLDALVRRLVPELYEHGYASVAMRFLGGPQVPALLARHHFVRRDDTRVVALALGTRREWALADPASWYLTDCDEDC